MFCPSCGKSVPDGAKFCTNCGHDLTAPAPDAPTAPATPAKKPTPRWLIALVAVLAVAVVGVGSYALTRAATEPGADASQTAQKKADGGKKSAKPTGGAKADAGKSDASDTSGANSGAGEKDGGSAGGATSDDASYVVRAEGYQFALPSYWRGKVDVVVDEDEVEIYPKGYAPAAGDDHDKAALASLELEDGTEPDVAGDIGNFLVYSQTLGSQHVEVWATNWPWLVASGNTGYTGVSSTGELRALVDLSTGGSLTYDDAVRRGEGDDLVGMGAHNYLSAVPWDIKSVGAGA
ncbi:zinc ribbon domain-containing protein [Parafannyhessea umbonata]|uniref:Zinc-ribbon domain-containing protein n=1 Tax=Parafannyhessea umbonata TaxID=604330 RepID=A0A1G6HYE3_9ACTN|nr:zinc ribbon domain-containing protein [Parafannyhessea umbonata]SDB98506.1 zinc-ribbon domain-containing protein [Parafannyhessea umbonata]